MRIKVMCIQSYYNNQEDNKEIELDLLKEIRDVGIDEWNEQIEEKSENEFEKEVINREE